MEVIQREPYKWENDALLKYGKEETDKLIESQKRYEQMLLNVDCGECGWKNQGSIVERRNGTPFVIHFGLFTGNMCLRCRRDVTKKGA